MNQKLKSMDILKGIGIIMIIIVHNRHFLMQDMSGLRPLINYGQMGCQLFFFVSGFSLCYAWEHLSEPRRAPKYARFVLRRYLKTSFSRAARARSSYSYFCLITPYPVEVFLLISP